MNWEIVHHIVNHTLAITSFVMGMMMVIEFVNVRTGGLWSKKLQTSPWMQIVVGALMGVIPGCLGTYTIVSLYVHRVVTFPALMSTLIATTGDEAFFMFSSFPGKALAITGFLFVLSIIVGAVLQVAMKDKFVGLHGETSLPLHDQEPECHGHDHRSVKSNLKNISFVRALLMAGCLVILTLVGTGILGDDDDADAAWMKYSILGMFTVILIIVTVCKEHFLQEHLWEHVIKVHLPKIFFWTLGVMVVMAILDCFMDVESVISSNKYIVLLIAVAIGIIPQSGPHLIFVILFAQGSLPLSILIANSIVQDGHGTLPLIAESRKAFFVSKGISVVVGLIVGGVGILI